MKYDKLAMALKKPENAKQFASGFVDVFMSPAFGAISKTEVDNLVFGLLVEVGAIDSKAQIYEIARDLNVTPSKARNLLFQWQLRSMGEGNDLKSDLIESLKSVRFSKDGDFLVFGVESPLLREELRSRLKRLGVYADTSFSSEVIRISLKHFVEFLAVLLTEKEKQTVRKALVKDGLMKDKSFKAVAFRLLKGVAKKAAGEVGGELTDIFGEAIRGLVAAEVNDVTESVKNIDFSDNDLNYRS